MTTPLDNLFQDPTEALRARFLALGQTLSAQHGPAPVKALCAALKSAGASPEKCVKALASIAAAHLTPHEAQYLANNFTGGENLTELRHLLVATKRACRPVVVSSPRRPSAHSSWLAEEEAWASYRTRQASGVYAPVPEQGDIHRRALALDKAQEAAHLLPLPTDPHPLPASPAPEVPAPLRPVSTPVSVPSDPAPAPASSLLPVRGGLDVGGLEPLFNNPSFDAQIITFAPAYQIEGQTGIHVRSRTDATRTYTVHGRSCSCPARVRCWHLEAAALAPAWETAARRLASEGLRAEEIRRAWEGVATGWGKDVVGAMKAFCS